MSNELKPPKMLLRTKMVIVEKLLDSRCDLVNRTAHLSECFVTELYYL